MKNILLMAFVLSLLTGCSVDMADSMPDYKGTDIAYIRVDNTFQPTAFRLEKMLPAGDCWKSEHVYGLTSKIAIMGIKSSYSKKVDGIAPPSLGFAKKGFLEYSIQAGSTI